MKSHTTDLTNEIDAMKATVQAAANATPALIANATKVSGYKVTLWACAAFWVAWATFWFFLAVAIAGIRVAQFLWGMG